MTIVAMDLERAPRTAGVSKGYSWRGEGGLQRTEGFQGSEVHLSGVYDVLQSLICAVGDSRVDDQY